MFQILPTEEHYNQIERDLLSRNQAICLTVKELQEQQDTYRSQAGYVTYTGYVLTQVDADCLNRITDELNRTQSIKVREYLKDRRHQQFCIIAEQITPEQIHKAQLARDKKLNMAIAA